MANILHPNSYTDDGLDTSERKEMIRGRALSRALVTWVIGNYETKEMTTETFYWRYLAYQARAVCYAKKFAASKGLFGSLGINLATAVQKLTEESFRGIQSFWAEWDSFKDFEPENFAWPNSDPVLVETRTAKLQGTYTATFPINQRSIEAGFSSAFLSYQWLQL
jgi:hypothetical protein